MALDKQIEPVMRNMLPQFHLEAVKRMEAEKARVQNLVSAIRKISEEPEVDDITENILNELTMEKFTKPIKLPPIP